MQKYIPQIMKFKNSLDYEMFLKKHGRISVIDCYKELVFESFISHNPSVYFSSAKKKRLEFDKYFRSIRQHTNYYALGVWIFHSWNQCLYHLVSEDEYLFLRTIRNKNIITSEQQKRLYGKTVSVAGLSVGSNVLINFVRLGIGSTFNIADSDVISVSNFNRASYGFSDYGKSKIASVINSIHNIDPFLKVNSYFHGLKESLLEQFIDGTDLIVDAFDTFDLKLKLRKLARQKKIPIISGFDIEFGVLLIVERYDTEPNLDVSLFLNGYSPELLKKDVTVQEKTDFFINIIGRDYHSKAMLDSVLSVGGTLTGYPQLVIATSFAASLFTFAAEEILLGKNFPSIRKYLSLPSLLC